MSTSAVDIKASLITLLTNGIPSLSGLSDYAKDSFDEYPNGFLIFAGTRGEPRGNTRRLLTYRYRFAIYIEQGTNFEASKAERLTGEIADQLITALNSDVSLGGSVIDTRPVDFSADFDSNSVDSRVISGVIEVEKLENIFN